MLRILIISLFFTDTCFAYLDPGTGSLILQMLIAGFLSVVFAIKLYWYKFKTWVKLLFYKGDMPLEGEAEEEEIGSESNKNKPEH